MLAERESERFSPWQSENRPLYLLLSGFARGQALGCHAVARANRMQKSMQKHCRDTENDQSS